MKKFIIYLVTWFVVFFLCGYISQYYFTSEEITFSDNSFEITGDTTISTNDFSFNISLIDYLPRIHGSNWRVDIENLNNISYIIENQNESKELLRIINTKNLTIFGTFFQFFSESYMEGNIVFNKIKYIELTDDFQFILKGGIISLNSADEVYIGNPNLKFDDGELKFDTGISFHLNFSTNPKISINLGDGDYLDLMTYFVDRTLKISGEIKIEKFIGTKGIGGKFYFGGPIIIKGDNMTLYTFSLPESGIPHGPSPFGWAHEPQYWKFKINNEGDLIIEGFGLPYWSIGIIINLIVTGVILINYIIKKFRKKKERKKKDKVSINQNENILEERHFNLYHFNK